MNTIRIGTDKYHHQSGPSELRAELVAMIDAAKLADLLLMERWKGQCEIIPDYMPPLPNKDTRPKLVVRIRYDGYGEEHYSYLRYSCGPRQGFFWDIYGDDLMSVELAILALHQAPTPMYCGPVVFKLPLKP